MCNLEFQSLHKSKVVLIWKAVKLRRCKGAINCLQTSAKSIHHRELKVNPKKLQRKLYICSVVDFNPLSVNFSNFIVASCQNGSVNNQIYHLSSFYVGASTNSFVGRNSLLYLWAKNQKLSDPYLKCFIYECFVLLIARSHLLVSGHQRMVSTSKSCN